MEQLPPFGGKLAADVEMLGFALRRKRLGFLAWGIARDLGRLGSMKIRPNAGVKAKRPAQRHREPEFSHSHPRSAPKQLSQA